LSGKGLFVDLDGTLANSLTALREVYFLFLAGLGAKGNEGEFQRLNGLPLVKIIERLIEVHNLPGDPSELTARYSMMIRQIHSSAPPSRGAQELLKHARRKGWNVTVVTSSSRLSAVEWLERSSLSSQVDFVVGGDEVSCGKPAPDPYTLALSRSNCIPAVSLAVEDSRNGAFSAVSAGLSTWVLAAPDDRSGWPPEVGFIAGLPDLMAML
jgi:HAD superfamily hydrolase (TIGR01509 family)